MTSALDRARQAMGHPSLAWIAAEVPAALRDNPSVIRSLLVYAAGLDPALGESPVYAQAHSLLIAAGQERELADRISKLYWDPKIRARFGQERVEQAWNDPNTALEELKAMSVAGTLPAGLDQALDTLYQVREYARENNIAQPVAAETPLPTGAAADAERKALISKSVAGKLSPAENAKLNALIAAGASAEEVAAHRKALGVPAESGPVRAPAERRALYQKSSLTPAEDAQLNASIAADIAAASGDGGEQ